MTDKDERDDLVVVEELGNHRDAPQQVVETEDPVVAKTQAEVGAEEGPFEGVDPEEGDESLVDPDDVAKAEKADAAEAKKREKAANGA